MRQFLHILLFSLLFVVSSSLSLYSQDKLENLEEKLREESYREGEEANKIIDKIEDFGYKAANQADTLFNNLKDNFSSNDTVSSDTVALKPINKDWWWYRLRHGGIDMKDTTIVYPKFLNFCVNVYRWADKTFNSYDPEYVVGTGKRWKVRVVSDNWLDSYILHFPHGFNTSMSSDVYANIGAYLQYMAVSIGSSYDVGKIFNGKEPSHKKYDIGFICALFNAELYYHENRGGVKIRRFGDYGNGKLVNEFFPGVTLYELGVDAYYFFNNKRYSQGAAYNFAKYQLKSQGSFLLGFQYMHQRLSFDFGQLPEKFQDMLPLIGVSKYYFHYNSYAVLFGYGYNWVIAPKLLFNVSAMPAVGFSHYYADSHEGNKYLLSLNMQARISLTYNLGNYFFGIFGKINGNLYKQGTAQLFSSIENFSASAGLRF